MKDCHQTMYQQLTETLLRICNRSWKHLFTAWIVLFVTLTSSAQINWYVPHTNYSTARNWDERILETIRADTPNPPVQARNLFSYAVCMYDAWAAYDTNA